MINRAATKVKAKNGYTCSECGSMENIQAHHVIPGDDSTLISLCAVCHHGRHPDLPLGLFTNRGHQPYWPNISASSLSKKIGCHNRTVIRISKKLGIPTGEPISDASIGLIKQNYQEHPNREILTFSTKDRLKLLNLKESGVFDNLAHKIGIKEETLLSLLWGENVTYRSRLKVFRFLYPNRRPKNARV